MGAEVRLDVALVERGLARSRTAAARTIAAGTVRVNGTPQIRPAVKVGPGDVVDVDSVDRWVSRAAGKLIAALDHSAPDWLTASAGLAPRIDPRGRLCLDLGASTGGFTQVLLDRGAARVIALDVGHDQLDPLIRGDVRVIPIEGENARFLTAGRLNELLRRHRPEEGLISRDITLMVADLSFISLTHVLAPMRDVTAPSAEAIVLIKPQFEVGRTGVREGLVTDRTLAADAVERVVWSAWDAGYGLVALIPSPVVGTHGNREYVARLAPVPEHITDGSPLHPERWRHHIRALVERGDASPGPSIHEPAHEPAAERARETARKPARNPARRPDAAATKQPASGGQSGAASRQPAATGSDLSAAGARMDTP